MPRKFASRRGLALWLPFLIIVGCRRTAPVDASKFMIEIREGVRFVKNLAPQTVGSSTVRLELLGKIGKLEGRDSRDILYEPADAARLPNGDILVLETGGCVVKRYNAKYELISSFGGKGKGPGDFVSPYLLRLNPERNRIYVADSLISMFGLDGRFIDGFRYEAFGGTGSSLGQDFQTAGMAVLSGSRVVLPDDTTLWKGSVKNGLLRIYNESGQPVGTFGDILRFDDPYLTLNSNIVAFTADPEDNCYVAYSYQNRLDKYSPDGKLLFSASRPLPYEVKFGMKDLVFTSGSVKKILPWPSVTSVSRSVGVDEKGRVWVLTYLSEPDEYRKFDEKSDLSRCFRLDVFNGDGLLVFSVAPPNVPFDRFSLNGDRIYFIDPNYESCVYEYRIIETGS